MAAQYIREYKQGRKKNFFLRENEGTYFLEKETKSCGFTVKAGSENEVMDYIEANNFKLVRLISIEEDFSSWVCKYLFH